jgi:hypothetical protein
LYRRPRSRSAFFINKAPSKGGSAPKHIGGGRVSYGPVDAIPASVSVCLKSMTSTPDPHQGRRLLRLNLQERAMHGSELPPLAVPPISITCGACRNQMRLATIDPTNEQAVYTYECANGHQRKISTADPTSIRGTPTVQPIAGSAPPEPWEIFGALRNTSLPPSSVAQRDWPAIYLRRVLRPGS